MMNNELIPTPMMSFGESVKTCFQKYVTFKGRARRSEYWWFWLLNLIVSIVTLVLDYKLDMINIEFGIGALSGLYTLIVFLPSLAVSVRRLHDTGHSGWYYLLTFIPILGALFLLYFFVSDSAPEENVSVSAMLVSMRQKKSLKFLFLSDIFLFPPIRQQVPILA